jgi:hypothetical protein
LFEFDVNLEGEEAFDNLKELLLQKGCREVAEERPRFLSVKQGSIWGISPKTAKKTVECRLSPAGSKTHVAVSSSLSKDWRNLTVVGSLLSVVVAGFCLWISVDLEGFVATGQPSFWSWIVASGDLAHVQAALMFASLAGWLGFFLVVTVLVEGVVYAYAKSRVDGFAEEVLRTLGEKT